MRKRNESGVALLLALWALFLLGAMVMSWSLDLSSRMAVSSVENRILEARAMASSGAEIAMLPNLRPGSPNLKGQLAPRQTYRVQITGEGGRLNLNWLVAGENPARIEILRRYLEIKGIDLNERDHMVDCLLDWVDPDNLPRLNGAEAGDGYQPANALFTRLDQLKKVKGWEKFTAVPGWENELTLNSTGPIDVAWASRDVLRALPGMTDTLVDRFLQVRRGPDEIDWTEDDPEIKGIDDVRLAFGLDAQQFQQLAPFISLKDPVLRVVSTGRSGNINRTVEVVFRRAGLATQLITWKEI